SGCMSRPKSIFGATCALAILDTLRVTRMTVVFNVSSSACREDTTKGDNSWIRLRPNRPFLKKDSFGSEDCQICRHYATCLTPLCEYERGMAALVPLP